MSAGDLTVGLDLGTSSLKGVALRPDGALVARAQAPYATARPGPGRAEQAPMDWVRAVQAVVAALAAQVPPRHWQAIGLSGMIPTLVALDARGEPIGPAITWEDGRAEAQGEGLRTRVGGAALYARTGQWVDGRYLLPFAIWLREHEGEGRGRYVGLAGAKDWLFAWLTGALATDPSTATGYGCFDLDAGAWDDETLAAAFGSARPALPEVRPSATLAPLSRGASVALGAPRGLPVCLGAADSVLAARGLGVSAPGSVAYVAGTSTVILGVSHRQVRDPEHRYLVTPMDQPASYGLEMDLLTTGSAVRWIAELLGLPPGAEAAVWELAERSPRGADGLVLLPYLGPGEQGALWDPSLRGTLVGATLAHTRADLVRALLEGITLESRRCVGVLDAAGIGRGGIVIAGPSAAAAVVRQALADATGRLVRWPTAPDYPASAWGAAALAFEALGAEAPTPAGLDPGAQPDPDAAAAWGTLWDRHERVRTATSGLWAVP
ncbi:MAG: xylulokinase [Candidatus Limnocylindrales bacterium]